MGERVPVQRLFGAVVLALGVGCFSAAAHAAEPAVPPITTPSTLLAPPASPTSPAATGHATTASAPAGGALDGVFAITAGSCTGRTATGSTFRMIQPGGSVTGPFLANSDSPCGDQTVTPLAPGTDGGLSTSAYQPNPARAFDGTGNGTAAAITKPQKFMGVAFAVSTNAKDPQTGTAVAKPTVSNAGGKLGGDLRAVSVAYNNQHFNQGSPKPDGGHPGLTAGPTGTYDASTGAFVLEWTSTIVGGPFNGFTGKWHLEGTFRAASPGTATAAPAADTSAPATDAASASPAAPSAAASSSAASAPATHPHTGGTLPTGLGMACVLFGASGLALRRRVGVAATSGPERAPASATPAGDRARRP